MLWYTTRLISVPTNVMEYVHLTSHHLRQRKPPVLMTLISAIGTGGLVFSDCLHAADLVSCLCKILGAAVKGDGSEAQKRKMYNSRVISP